MPRSVLAATPALILLTGAAGAHPHTYVDQQVQLSLRLDVVDVTVVIVPSAKEGEAIFAHLDTQVDGFISPAEAADFGAAVLESMRLEVNGQEVELFGATVAIAEAEQVRTGNGAITVKAAAVLDLAPAAEHQIVFEVTYGELSHEWFVQPFYYPDLIEAFKAPELARSAEGEQVTIMLGG